MATLIVRFPSKRSPNFWRDTARGYFFILPVVFGLLIWTLGPMIASAYYSLTNYKIINAPQFIGFQNYIDLFTNDKLFIQSLKVTLIFAFLFVTVGQIVSLEIGRAHV